MQHDLFLGFPSRQLTEIRLAALAKHQLKGDERKIWWCSAIRQDRRAPCCHKWVLFQCIVPPQNSERCRQAAAAWLNAAGSHTTVTKSYKCSDHGQTVVPWLPQATWKAPKSFDGATRWVQHHTSPSTVLLTSKPRGCESSHLRYTTDSTAPTSSVAVLLESFLFAAGFYRPDNKRFHAFPGRNRDWKFQFK